MGINRIFTTYGQQSEDIADARLLELADLIYNKGMKRKQVAFLWGVSIQRINAMYVRFSNKRQDGLI